MIFNSTFSFAENKEPSQNKRKTFCNPINIDYGFCPFPEYTINGKHRATADPVIVLFKGDYFLFSTNQQGYWWSSDLLQWNFISRSFLKPQIKTYNDLCCLAAFATDEGLFVLGSSHEKDAPLWVSSNPKTNEWKIKVDSFQVPNGDPAFFKDDNGKFYFYYGTSNLYPIYGIEINPKTFLPIGKKKELMHLKPLQYGWQRFGEYLDDIFIDPFIEGPWMNKYKGKYYLQYGAPGTEFSHYADGVMVSDKPLGPFTPQIHNPFSSKAGGFIRGSGHGATFEDKWNNWWHVSSMVVSVKNSFERRLGLWPAGFDKDGLLYTDTAFGDYPTYVANGPEDHLKSSFTGWMLLNYNKPVLVSSTLGAAFNANNAVDENIKTYWSASTSNKGEWIQTDLGSLSTVNAIQINYADQDVEIMGKSLEIYHQYIIYSSSDGLKWNILIDKSKNKTDVPHDYVDLETPIQARYLKLENIHMSSGKFAISGFRVFGKGNGNKPDPVKNFNVLRTQKDKRSAWIKWKIVDNAYAYNIYYGIASDKLYTSIMVHGENQYFFKSMDKNRAYYFTIEAINENGISEKTPIIKVN